ncbi:hypothetical protein SAMN05446037_1007139 [Anaerovirgula multivorans]|uniref:Bacterial Ig-like domain-containing protein n=1 Tax=Anaerovirgula multivorans TaxID=312168 RepID=A0A239DEL0_9FIRM|nr:immunoglobulin-like domain-containing protein [Anaerovirgula multivorans]SNS30825.1 hypothetical protein SAMN05446037_1007139 [Anaerovirgula multivorans]
MKKKLLTMLMSGALIFVLTACSASGSEVSNGLDGASNSYTDVDGNAIAVDGVKGEIGETDFEVVTTDYAVVNELKGVTLRVKKDSISPTSITLIFENNSDKEYQYGTFYCIERKNDDTWTKLSYDIEGAVGWNDIAYMLPAKQSLEETVEWDWLYSSLAEGEYRIIKQFFDFRSAGDYDSYDLAAEFVIE